MSPLISIITPTLNSGKTLRTSLESVANQTIPCEHILVDGGSTDDTKEIASEFENVIFIDAPGSSIYEAQNIGLPLVKGDWVYFLGSDDWMFSNDTMRLAIRSAGISKVLHGKVEIPGISTEIYGPIQQAWIYHNSIFKEYGGFDPSHPVHADFEFNKKLVDLGVRNKKIDLILAHFSLGGVSMRGRK